MLKKLILLSLLSFVSFGAASCDSNKEGVQDQPVNNPGSQTNDNNNKENDTLVSKIVGKNFTVKSIDEYELLKDLVVFPDGTTMAFYLDGFIGSTYEFKDDNTYAWVILDTSGSNGQSFEGNYTLNKDKGVMIPDRMTRISGGEKQSSSKIQDEYKKEEEISLVDNVVKVTYTSDIAPYQKEVMKDYVIHFNLEPLE